jgi:hypothetical protein
MYGQPEGDKACASKWVNGNSNDEGALTWSRSRQPNPIALAFGRRSGRAAFPPRHALRPPGGLL